MFIIKTSTGCIHAAAMLELRTALEKSLASHLHLGSPSVLVLLCFVVFVLVSF